MDLSLSETETALADAVRSFVDRSATTSKLVGMQKSGEEFRPEWTSALADAGWLGALVPVTLGGSGATCLQAGLICEALGAAPFPGPFLVSSVIGALLLRACEPAPRRDELLTAIADGMATVVPILSATGSGWNGLAEPADRMGVKRGEISGLVPYVAHARRATHYLVPLAAPTTGDDIEFGLVPAKLAGIEVRRLTGFLAAHDEVAFSDVPIADEVLRCSIEDVRQALARCYALVSSYIVGGCQALLEWSIEHSNTRVQFGVPVGKFQRVQDHIVELVNALDAARWATYEALWLIDSKQECRAGTHMAKAISSDAYITCTDAAHKVHAGIGMDPDFGLTLYTQTARTLYNFLGHPRWHRREMAAVRGWFT